MCCCRHGKFRIGNGLYNIKLTGARLCKIAVFEDAFNIQFRFWCHFIHAFLCIYLATFEVIVFCILYLKYCRLILLLLIYFSYCKKCVNLHLEVSLSDCVIRFKDEDNYGADRDAACLKFFPKLISMKSLRSLVIWKKSRCIYEDECLHKLIKKICSVAQLERLWVEGVCTIHSLQCVNLVSADCVTMKSISLNARCLFLRGNNFRQLQHVSGSTISKMADFPNLRYVHGYLHSRDVSNYCLSKRLFFNRKLS